MYKNFLLFMFVIILDLSKFDLSKHVNIYKTSVWNYKKLP